MPSSYFCSQSLTTDLSTAFPLGRLANFCPSGLFVKLDSEKKITGVTMGGEEEQNAIVRRPQYQRHPRTHTSFERQGTFRIAIFPDLSKTRTPTHTRIRMMEVRQGFFSPIACKLQRRPKTGAVVLILVLSTPDEMVRALNLKFRRPRMPHARAPRMSHVWYHADRHEQWKRVT